MPFMFLSPIRPFQLPNHMAFPNSLCFFLVLYLTTFCPTYAYIIEVGGDNGWIVAPREDYNVWATRMRFSVNDTLHFKYNKDSDSVLVVTKDDYEKCNSNNPITKLVGGDSNYVFDRSGPIYFITGNKANCDQGQKFHLTVLTVRNNQSPSSSIVVSPSVRPEFSTAASIVSLVMISLGFIGFVGVL